VTPLTEFWGSQLFLRLTVICGVYHYLWGWQSMGQCSVLSQ
jgi:hypothetical protein